MRMWTYIVRRIILVVPVLIGVTTITFLLFQALPVSDRLISLRGESPHSSPCYYNPECPCASLDPGSVRLGPNGTYTCKCIDPTVLVKSTTECPSPYFKKFYDLLGLNKPIPEQWALYVYRAFTFQWGRVSNNSALGTTNGLSFLKDVPVSKAISEELPYTLELSFVSLALIMVIAIPLGNYTAVNRNRGADQAARMMSFSGFALAPFLLGNLVIVGCVLLILPHIPSSASGNIYPPWCHTQSGEPVLDEFQGSWPPPSCYSFGNDTPTFVNGVASSPTGFPTVDAMWHGQYWLALDTLIRVLLPALVITYGSVALLLRFVRNSMLEVMNLDFVRTARAKGVPESVVVSRHAGRNSLNVTITVLGLTFAGFLGGFPVIESVFGLNGVGRLFAYSVLVPIDYAVIFGSTLLFTFIVVSANIIVDVLYAYLDPRVRLG